VHGIVHLASTIPNSDAATEDDWPYSAEVVSGMMKRLIIASEQSGVRTMVFPSTYGVYGKTEGLEWVTEGTRVHADRNSQPFIDAEQALNLSSTRRKSTGVVLRMGIVYHHDSPSTKGLLYALKNGHAETIGDGAMYWPLIHAEDAVQAIRLALEEGPRGEVFNVADNEPVTQHTLYTTLAELIGAPLPRRGTGEINHYLRGGNPADLYRSVRLSNEKLRDRLGFEASYPTFRTGFRAVAEKLNYVEESQA
jgi:nucleoside-diphosphate-sugar epimerase